jgi:hypothetical protein
MSSRGKKSSIIQSFSSPSRCSANPRSRSLVCLWISLLIRMFFQVLQTTLFIIMEIKIQDLSGFNPNDHHISHFNWNSRSSKWFKIDSAESELFHSNLDTQLWPNPSLNCSQLRDRSRDSAWGMTHIYTLADGLLIASNSISSISRRKDIRWLQFHEFIDLFIYSV